MPAKSVAVLDFGSSKITVLVGSPNVNNNFKILSNGQADYAGFMDGEFLEPNTLKFSVDSAIKKAEEGLRDKIKLLYVGVPSEFCKTAETELEVNFGSRTLIKQKHIDQMFANSDNIFDSSYVVISLSPMYFTLDDGSKSSSPVGTYSTSLKARVSIVYVENKFVHMINSIIHDVSGAECEFVCSTLAEGIYLLDADQRNSGAILVDSGYITTSVSHFIGEGLADLRSFSQGGGFISGDLSEALDISFGDAEQLKRKLILSIQATGIDYYEIVSGDKLVKIPAKQAGDVALARIDTIIDSIKESIASFDNIADPDAPVYLTGGGLSYLKGAKNYISKMLGRKVIIARPKALQYRSPELSSVLGLLNFALDSEK